MYHKISISKLSKSQILKLLRGRRIRVKYGSGLDIDVSEEQHKKITKAHKHNNGCVIQFDPYQQQNHEHLKTAKLPSVEGGSLLSVAKSVGKTILPVAKQALPVVEKILVDVVKDTIKKKVGLGVKHKGTAEHTHVIHKGKKGKGVKSKIPAVKEVIEKVIENALPIATTALLGLGVKRGRGRPKKEKGGALLPAGYSS